MGDDREVLVKVAADVGKYYAFVGQALRAIYDRDAAAQLPSELLDAQLVQLRAALAPVLEKNPVVKENFERVDQDLARIRKAASPDEARSYGGQIQERAKAVSDLVALFRRL